MDTDTDTDTATDTDALAWGVETTQQPINDKHLRRAKPFGALNPLAR